MTVRAVSPSPTSSRSISGEPQRAAGNGRKGHVLAVHEGACGDGEPVGAGILRHVEGRFGGDGAVGTGRVGPADLAVGILEALVDGIAEGRGPADGPVQRQAGPVQGDLLGEGRTAAVIAVFEVERIAVVGGGDLERADFCAAHHHDEAAGLLGRGGIRPGGGFGRALVAAGQQNDGKAGGQDRLDRQTHEFPLR